MCGGSHETQDLVTALAVGSSDEVLLSLSLYPPAPRATNKNGLWVLLQELLTPVVGSCARSFLFMILWPCRSLSLAALT